MCYVVEFIKWYNVITHFKIIMLLKNKKIYKLH